MTVYFARATALGHIKIGYVHGESAAAVTKRLTQIGRLVGSPMELLAVAPGKFRLERWYHQRHADAAIGGEWFRHSPELDADIAALRAGRPHADAPAPRPFPHHRGYRWWQVVTRSNGSTYWAPRYVKPAHLRQAVERCSRAA